MLKNRIQTKGHNGFKIRKFFSFVSYYMLILLVLFTVATIIFFSSMNVTKKKVIEANRVIINQLRTNIEQRMKNLQRYTIQVGFDDNIKILLYNTESPLDSNSRFNLIKQIQRLKEQETSDEFIKRIYIYLVKSSIVVSSKEYLSIKERLFDDENKYLYDWLYLIQERHDGETYFVPSNDNEENSIVYLKSLPLNSKGIIYGNIVIELNNNYLNDIVDAHRQATNKDISFAILNDKEELIYYNGIDELSWFLKKNKLPDNFQFISVNKKNDYYTYLIKSEESGLQYVMILPTSELSNELKRVWFIGGAGFFIAIIMSLVVIMTIKKRQYDYFESVVRLLQDNESDINKMNYFIYIEKAVQDMVVSNNKMKQYVDKNKIILQNYFLIRLLQGELSEEVYKDFIKYYDIKLENKYFSVFIFYHNVSDYNSEDEREEFMKILNSIQNEFKNSFSVGDKEAQFYSVLVKEILVCITNYPEIQDITLSSWLNTFDKKLKDKNIIISISKEKTNVMELSEAYEESKKVLEYMLVYGKKGVIKFSSLIVNRPVVDIKYYQYENNFIKMLNNGEFNKAENIVNNLFRLVLNQQDINLTVVKCRMFGLINILMNQVDKLNLSKDLIKFDNVYERLISFQKIDDLRIEIVKIIRTIGKYVDSESIQDTSDILSEIDKYIQENYANEELTVSYLADLYNINITALSKKFKKMKNINLSDYIHKIRLEAAKKMILETDLPIKEIAIACGYYNSDKFIRIFRRYEGITPGKYRSTVK